MSENIGKQCTRCYHKMYPPHPRCRNCKGTSFKSFEFGRGRLLTRTILYVTNKDVKSPVTLGIAEFEGGVRAIGGIPSDIRIGAEVELTVRKTGKEESRYHNIQFKKVV